MASETAASKLGGNNSQGQKRLINAESRLMEWIQQNRPRPGSNPISEPQKEQRNGTNGMDGGLAKDWQWAMGATDKLPYYGKYCGSFVEQVGQK